MFGDTVRAAVGVKKQSGQEPGQSPRVEVTSPWSRARADDCQKVRPMSQPENDPGHDLPERKEQKGQSRTNRWASPQEGVTDSQQVAQQMAEEYGHGQVGRAPSEEEQRGYDVGRGWQVGRAQQGGWAPGTGWLESLGPL